MTCDSHSFALKSHCAQETRQSQPLYRQTLQNDRFRWNSPCHLCRLEDSASTLHSSIDRLRPKRPLGRSRRSRTDCCSFTRWNRGLCLCICWTFDNVPRRVCHNTMPVESGKTSIRNLFPCKWIESSCSANPPTIKYSNLLRKSNYGWP